MKTFLLVSMAILNGAVTMAQVTFGPYTKQYTSGAIGIVAGQTARWNIVYPTIPAPFAAQALCQAAIAIADERGNILASKDVPPLIGGNSVSLDLNADTQALPAGGRIQIHGFASTGGCSLVTTLEIVDNATQKAVVVLDGKLTYPLRPVLNQTRILQ